MPKKIYGTHRNSTSGMTAHLLLALVAMAAVDIDCAEYVKCNPTVMLCITVVPAVIGRFGLKRHP